MAGVTLFVAVQLASRTAESMQGSINPAEGSVQNHHNVRIHVGMHRCRLNGMPPVSHKGGGAWSHCVELCTVIMKNDSERNTYHVYDCLYFASVLSLVRLENRSLKQYFFFISINRKIFIVNCN